jgi:excisionase family DNA binding protein
MTDDDLEMLTVKEVADFMKVNVRTVQLWVNSGDLARTWIGSREYRISKADLRVFIQKRKEPPPDTNDKS